MPSEILEFGRNCLSSAPHRWRELNSNVKAPNQMIWMTAFWEFGCRQRASFVVVVGPKPPDKYMFKRVFQMRLDEIKPISAAESRVDRLKDNAKRAGKRAKLMSTQAQASADQLTQQKSRQKLAQKSKSTVGTTIKPHA
jgi:hypothetical protein